MKAKLFVRGMREPVELQIDEGVEAQRVISDAKISKDTPFSIEGVWTGTKADMKFVVFPEKEESASAYHNALEVMSKTEADAFSKELEPYRKEAVREGFKEYHGDVFWLRGQNCIRLNFDFKGSNSPYYAIVITDPVKWRDADNKIEAYKAYLSKVGYAQRAETARLEEMAAKEELTRRTKIDPKPL